MDFDLQLDASELGEIAFVRSLTSRREALLKKLADAPAQFEYLLKLSAEADVLRTFYKETRILVESERAQRLQKAGKTGNVIRR